MAEERDVGDRPHGGQGAHGVDPLVEESQRGILPGNRPSYPVRESEYWQEIYSREPYFEAGRSFGDYGPAYELGWVSYTVYGADLDAADGMLANDWEQRKGLSTLSWDQARPAARAAWQRAENARSFITDGTASHEQVIETLNDLLETERDAESGFREAAEHAKTPQLRALFGHRAESCRENASDLLVEIRRLQGKVKEGGTVKGAAHRIWIHIRGLFGGASDETMLHECERAEDATVACYRKALRQNLPQGIHEMVQRQFETAQRNHDMIKSLRDQARGETRQKSDDGQ
jgi:uncharacterized protein (TIGR02284 family)